MYQPITRRTRKLFWVVLIFFSPLFGQSASLAENFPHAVRNFAPADSDHLMALFDGIDIPAEYRQLNLWQARLIRFERAQHATTRRASQQRTAMFTMLLTISVLVAGRLYYMYRTHKRQAVSFQDEVVEIKALAEEKAAENTLLQEDVAHKRADLEKMVHNLAHNYEWTLQLIEQLDAVKKIKGRAHYHALAELEKEVKTKVHFDENAREFQQQVTEIGTDFQERLLTAFPNLSKTEFKLCSLIRMNLSTKEIAKMQFISPESVNKSRYRIRKKLGLHRNQGLDIFLTRF